VTTLLREARGADDTDRERFYRAVHAEFQRIAAALIRRERPGHTPGPSDLVNEAVLRLAGGEVLDRAPGRRYPFKATAAMRPALVVVLRSFAGPSVAELADALGVSVATVESDRRVARAWPRGQLKGADP
jgi:DNA-directed RNA polymerase specialized sigma24 family protein